MSPGEEIESVAELIKYVRTEESDDVIALFFEVRAIFEI